MQQTTVKDFFISYNKNDKHWAEWVAWQLEENGYEVIIQAWDFRGNFIFEMDRAMKESKATIAILSPHYINALFTHAEWADAFRKDPTSSNNILIPVRVAPVELSGILAQLNYVDFVGQDEETDRDLLLKRVKGLRVKPGKSPHFPGAANPSPSTEHQQVKRKPIFPPEQAALQDEKLLRDLSELVIQWRGKYGVQRDALQKAWNQLEDWQQHPPGKVDSSMIEVFRLASEIAHDFNNLSKPLLAYAGKYGLYIHSAVNDGIAIDFALNNSVIEYIIDHDSQVEVENTGQENEKWLPEPPGRYTYEQMGRVVKAAIAIATFDLTQLPRGFLTKPDQVIKTELRNYTNLIIATKNYEPGLILLSVDNGLEELGTFLARNAGLTPLSAWRNQDGTVDVIAKDNLYLYYWSASQQQPSFQIPEQDLIYDIQHVTSEDHLALVIVKRSVKAITSEGKYTILQQFDPNTNVSGAQIWIDPLQRQNWYAIVLTDQHEVLSGLHGQFTAHRSSAELWNHTKFIAAADEIGRWHDFPNLKQGSLNGLPCLMVERQASWGSGIWFLDPKSLTPLRPPLVIKKAILDMTLVAGRWLLTSMMARGNRSHRIYLWDLDSNTDEPIGSWLEGWGDMETPIPINENKNSFTTLQVFRDFEPAPNNEYYKLYQFEWPKGECKMLNAYTYLRIRNVSAL